MTVRGDDLPVDLPPWWPVARAEIGQREQVGAAHNPRILEYLRGTTVPPAMAARDETPWCAAFVDWVLKRAGYAGTSNAAAASFLSWGRPLGAPRVGCVVVIRRRDGGTGGSTGTATGNHVAFYVRGDARSITLLGGNQSDRVRESSYLLSAWEVRGYRWPTARTPLTVPRG